MENACRICKRLVEGSECPVCKSKDLTKNWKGVVIIYDVNSEIAKKTGHDTPGKYALQVI
ncbi:MAG: DNA-directed RNA polymerase subunit E'' [DPANN group archaeon]|nr:DNA-directed RNA polymerase subunit E'' [DPANN group archaeon]